MHSDTNAICEEHIFFVYKYLVLTLFDKIRTCFEILA